jgi:hypothetical protein
VDPVSLIVLAVAACAAAGLKESAADAVKEAYGALKRMILERHRVDVGDVERKPESEPKRASLKEDLADAGAGDDVELREAAKQLLAEVAKHDPAAARAAGVDLDDVTAEFIRIGNVAVSGPGAGVEATAVHVRGGIVIGDVRVDGRGEPDHP